MKKPWFFLLSLSILGLYAACSNEADQDSACDDISCDAYLTDAQVRRFLDPFGAGNPLETPMYKIQYWCGVEFTPASFFKYDARRLDSLSGVADSLGREWSGMMALRADWGRQVMDSLGQGGPLDSIQLAWFKEQLAVYDMNLSLSSQGLEDYRAYQDKYGHLLKQHMALRDSIMTRYPCFYDLLKKCAGEVPGYFPNYNDLQS